MHLAAASAALNDLALIFTIGAIAVLSLAGLSVAAVILKIACHAAGVEPPDTGKAMAVSLVESLVGSLAYLAATLTAGTTATIMHLDQATLGAMCGFSALGVSLIVPAGLYVPMLRVEFPKGLLISIIRYTITLTFVAAALLLMAAATGKVKYL